jgi:hypothetical protein
MYVERWVERQAGWKGVQSRCGLTKAKLWRDDSGIEASASGGDVRSGSWHCEDSEVLRRRVVRLSEANCLPFPSLPQRARDPSKRDAASDV